MSAASIQIGINYRDFPSNWRPARQEIVFARAAGFTSMQFHGPDDGLDTERLGDSPQVVGALLREAGDLVGHVHFADSNRRAIGLGQTRVAPIIAALRAIGYNGCLSAEIFPLPDAATAAAQTIKAFKQALAAS